VNATGVAVELYENDGSAGAALGAGVGSGIYHSFGEAYTKFKPLSTYEPTNTELYNELYNEWRKLLETHLG
jgi:xylulokinase